jgi:hypothetical protein
MVWYFWNADYPGHGCSYISSEFHGECWDIAYRWQRFCVFSIYHNFLSLLVQNLKNSYSVLLEKPKKRGNSGDLGLDRIIILRWCLVVSWLRRLVAGLSPRRPEFDPESVHVGFVVDKVALGEVFPRVLHFSPVNFNRIRECVLHAFELG